MSFDIFIKLNGDLSDIMYQTSAAFIVACKSNKRLTVSVYNINKDYLALLKNIKQHHSVTCQNTFNDSIIIGDDLCAYIPKCKKNMEMIGTFENKNYFKDYKDVLVKVYNLETDKDYSNSMYIYIDNSYLNNKEKYLEIINSNMDNSLEIIIDSDKYDTIKGELLEVYKEVSIVENNEYKKLIVMANCGRGGYYRGKTLGWWGAFLNNFSNNNYKIENINCNVVNKGENQDVLDKDKWNFINKIIYINLEKCLDRRKNIEKILSDVPSEKVIRFNAIEDKKGYIGCTKSHIECLRMARDNNWKNVMILEDDIIWDENFDIAFENLKRLMNVSYDVIVLGITFSTVDKISYRLYEGQTTTGYIVCNSYYDKLISNFKHGLIKLLQTDSRNKYTIDLYWKILQKQDNWYYCYPGLILQGPFYSNIENKYVDYTENFREIKYV